jgi:hypothetical protein
LAIEKGKRVQGFRDKTTILAEFSEIYRARARFFIRINLTGRQHNDEKDEDLVTPSQQAPKLPGNKI